MSYSGMPGKLGSGQNDISGGQQIHQPVLAQPSYPPQIPMRVEPPNPRGLPTDALGRREWNHKLFACFDDMDHCCTACWLGCPTYSLTHSKIRALRHNGYPHPRGGEFCGGAAWAFGAITWFFGMGWIMAALQRTEVRERYAVRGNGCNDCLAATFCFPCTQVQQLREIEDEERYIRETKPAGSPTHPQQMYPPQPQPSHAFQPTQPAQPAQPTQPAQPARPEFDDNAPAPAYDGPPAEDQITDHHVIAGGSSGQYGGGSDRYQDRRDQKTAAYSVKR